MIGAGQTGAGTGVSGRARCVPAVGRVSVALGRLKDEFIGCGLSTLVQAAQQGPQMAVSLCFSGLWCLHCLLCCNR